MAHRPIVSLDADGVLLDMVSPWMDWLREFRKGLQVDISSIRQWDIDQAFGLRPSTQEQFWREFFELYLQPLPFSQELVDGLRDKYEVIVITARAQDTGLAIAKEALWHHFAFPPGYVLSSKNKAALLKEVGAVAHVDDQWKTAMQIGLAWEGEKEKHSFLVNRPWNQSLDLDVPYQRVWSYKEILDELR